jgi:hypothetical protein
VSHTATNRGFAQWSYLVLVAFCVLVFAFATVIGAGIDLGPVSSSVMATLRMGTESTNSPANVDASTYRQLSAVDKALADSDSNLAQAAADVKEATNP